MAACLDWRPADVETRCHRRSEREQEPNVPDPHNLSQIG
jgi:hypothetical protein